MEDNKRYILDPDNFTGSVVTTMQDGIHNDYNKNETIEEIRIRNNNPNLKALTYEELLPLWIKYEKSIHKPFEEISEERFYDLFGCVPPLRNARASFFCGECYTGTTHRFCFKRNNKYYSALRNIKTPDDVLYKEIDDFMNQINSKHDTETSTKEI